MAFIGTRRNGLSFLCSSKKQVKKQFALYSFTYSAREAIITYFVRRWISLFSSFPVSLGLYFLPGIILSFLSLFWVCFVVHLFGLGCMCVPSDCW